MTGRVRLDDLNDDQLDALHARLDTAETLLREAADHTAVVHAHAGQGGHDVLGADLSCAGCDLAHRIEQHLNTTTATKEN